MHLRLRLSGSGSQESPLRQPSVAKSCDYQTNQRHHQQASGGFLPIGCIFSNKRTAPTNQSNAKVLRLRKSRPVWLTMFYCMLKGFWVRHYEPEILSVGSCSWLLILRSSRWRFENASRPIVMRCLFRRPCAKSRRVPL